MQRLPRILSRSEKRVKFLRFSLHVTSHMQRKSPCLILLPSEAGRRSQTDNNPWRDALHQQEVIDQQQLRQHAPHAVRATAATAVTVMPQPCGLRIYGMRSICLGLSRRVRSFGQAATNMNAPFDSAPLWTLKTAMSAVARITISMRPN